MTLYAATATPPAATYAWLVLAALVWALIYTAKCAAAPFTGCRRCHGAGKKIKPNGRIKRWCRRCDGTGLRLRWGRRAYNYLRRLRRDGTR
ncbi:hypothetical protein [Nonomuraea sp. NPDC050540]|uniref:hypothetical protein n=1 Tax=Nonomuraea sp. NPDC050540 TaxID=3364367 RepID=UPI0037B0E34C